MLTSHQQRILSALILGPAFLLIMALGGVVFTAFIILISLIAYFEFLNLIKRFKSQLVQYFLYAAAGMGYVALTAFCLIWLRGFAGGTGAFPQWLLLFMVMISVWMTDSCAYFSGRAFKGPKLAPAISPNKTWSGLLGGMAGSSLALGLTAWAYSLDTWGVYFAVGAVLAIVAQAGDLFESYLKRKAGVKDSGRLIPGHGGVLDRIDGLLAAAPCFALFIRLFT